MLVLCRKATNLRLNRPVITIAPSVQRMLSTGNPAPPNKDDGRRPNMVQNMPEYQKALQFAVDRKFEESLGCLQDALKQINEQVGPNTNFHLFLYQKIASLQMMTHDLHATEDTFKKCIDVAENASMPLNPTMDQAANVFMWQNNLLKFYLENDIDKAISFGKELTEEFGQILPKADQDDLKFSLATSYALKGDLIEFDAVKKMFEECAEEMQPAQRGFVLNNLGMWHFFSFIRASTELKDPQGAGMDAIQPIIDNYEAAVLNLKKSVRSFELFELAFEDLKGQDAQVLLEQEVTSQDDTSGSEGTRVPVAMIKAKLFSDEFFNLEPPGELLPTEFKHYDLKQNAANEQLLATAIRSSQTILPIQNLGEVAFIMQRYKDSFAFLDAALKLYKIHDMHNLLKFKVLTLLGSLLETQGDTQSMERIHQTVFKQLEPVDCFEKVFATRNYGYLLAKNDQTRLEGQDLIKKSEEMAKAYPYWAERKMGLFVPQMQVLQDEQFNL